MMKIIPSGAALGARVESIDLAKPLSAADDSPVSNHDGPDRNLARLGPAFGERQRLAHEYSMHAVDGSRRPRAGRDAGPEFAATLSRSKHKEIG